MGSEIQDTRGPECLLCAGECPECGFDIDGMRSRVAELEAKLAESEAWAKVGRAGYRLRQASIAQVMEPGMVNGDSMDTAQFEFEATLAAATKRAGEEQDGN